MAEFQKNVRARGLAAEHAATFRQIIYDHFDSHGRGHLPWRADYEPYHIFVSEFMLQQTQVSRVIDKYTAFIERFPDVDALATAPLKDVIAAWQGLGYNRRAIALKKSAEVIVSDYGGIVPDSQEQLMKLPGIGHYTASAICAFAFNQPLVFIETNIRAVFIHFFFQRRNGVTDNELLPLIEQTLDREHPRRWYSALMDYGVMLKKRHSNPSRKSAHHAKQSRFEGSDRQIRGLILKKLAAEGELTEQKLIDAIGKDADRVKQIIVQLQKEGFIVKRGQTFTFD